MAISGEDFITAANNGMLMNIKQTNLVGEFDAETVDIARSLTTVIKAGIVIMNTCIFILMQQLIQKPEGYPMLPICLVLTMSWFIADSYLDLIDMSILGLETSEQIYREIQPNYSQKEDYSYPKWQA